MTKKSIKIVPHTHWDREWYFTDAKSKIYLVNDMQEILDMLEQHYDYVCYVLDGQTVVLEDYLSVVPEDEPRIKKLVQADRLKIGPWYTQTDEMVVAGESIVRNLLYGKLDCDKFGGRMMIGYLPDSFGQSAAMPKILNGFGIDKSLFWRGYSERLGINQTEFLWEADDGSQTTVQLLPINYSVGIMIPKDAKKIRERFDKALPLLEKYSTTGDLLVPNGHDQMPVQQDIFEIMELMRKEYPDYDIKLSTYEDQFKKIDKKSITKITSELLDGKYQRIHRSIYSSRADLKSANTRIENKISNILEPIASICYSLGFDYQSGTIEQIWREMLKNHAHDSICCCNTDKVNKQVENRFVTSGDMVDNLTDFYMRKILEAIPGDEDKLVVFNTLPQDRKESLKVNISTPFDDFDLQDVDGNKIDYDIISKESSVVRDEAEDSLKNYSKYQISICDEIPALGYKVYKILKSDEKRNSIITSRDKSIENKFYKIHINNNGSLNIDDKKTGNTYHNVLLLEDSADGGDSYDYSPIEDDWTLTSEDVSAEVQTMSGASFEEAKINYRFKVPKNLESRRFKQADSYVDVEINVLLPLASSNIELEFNIDNQAKDHRLRVLVPQNTSANNSVADIQFGKIKRAVYNKAVDVWQEENWDERPDTIFPFLNYVHTDTQAGLAVLSNSVREYQIIDGQAPSDTIAITLFRSYGHQGRKDLLRRPGRASGTNTPTPDAQLIGKNTYKLGLTSEIKDVAGLANAYTTPFVYYAFDPAEDLMLNKSNVEVPEKYSLLNFEISGIILSALKKAESGKGLVIRMFNSSSTPQKLNISGVRKIASELMLDETEKCQIKGDSQIEFKPFEIKTFMLN